MPIYSFCPDCLGIFHSRAFAGATNISHCAEVCIFCGSTAQSESDLNGLKPIVFHAYREKMLTQDDIGVITSVLARLERGEVSVDDAEIEIETVSPGLGKRICGAVRKYGVSVATIFIASLGLYVQFQMVASSNEANELSRRALEHAIEQSRSVDDLPEGKPSHTQVQKPHPQSPIKKNRKLRRAEEAQKRRKR